jgi:phage tail-like protein
MQVANLKAEPDVRGGRILLTWTNPADAATVKILRRESTFPVVPDDFGSTLEIYDQPAQPDAAGSFLDSGLQGSLKGETVYYYAVVARNGTAQNFPAFVSAMTTSPFQTGAYLYKNLPGIYQTFDTPTVPTPAGVDPADANKGQLLRFMEMFGLQFDLIRSFVAGMRTFYDLRRIDANLLPLLAQWTGWETDFTLPVSKQRNEVQYAPHFYRTTGVAANLRAMINRVSTWDARIKEFAHNIFRSNQPEQLTISEMKRTAGTWQPAEVTNLEAAYEGRVSAVTGLDQRPGIFYHTSEETPVNGSRFETHWHLFYKIFEQDGWQPAHRLTSGAVVDRFPAAIPRGDGSVWLFWARYQPASGAPLVPEVKLQVLATGRAALPARIQGTLSGPFALADGNQFQIAITAGPTINRRVTFRREDFININQASVEEVAAVLERELPGITVQVVNNMLLFHSQAAGSSVSMTVPAFGVAATLGVAPQTAAGTNALGAKLVSAGLEPFNLANGDQLTILRGGDMPRTITFQSISFSNIAAAKAAEIATVINQEIPGTASADAGKVVLISSEAGEAALVSVDASSSAAAKIGFGVPPPGISGVDESEPAVFEDLNSRLWLFWSSRRTGAWKIWFSRLDANGWGAPKQLTTGALPDCQPGVLFDPGPGRLWVFWSRKKANGLWNIFYRHTTKQDFTTLVDTDWIEVELTPVPPDPSIGGYDNCEPMPLLLGADSLELYFSSNRSNGWNTWSKPLTSATQNADAQVTFGQFTQRAPSPLKTAPNEVKLWFRTNATQFYTSKLYPAAQTVDARYSGSTTADTRNPARLSFRQNIQDIQHYTYHARVPAGSLSAAEIEAQEEKRLYSRDTVGIYLVPDTNDEQLIIRNRVLIAEVLSKFLPIQVRAVFLLDQAFTEFVYDYDGAGRDAPLIGERMIDTILSEALGPITEDHKDTAGFKFIRTWMAGTDTGVMPDLTVHPPTLSFRLPVIGLEEEA